MIDRSSRDARKPCLTCGKPAGPYHWHCPNCGEVTNYQSHMLDGRYSCSRRFVPRFQLQGLGGPSAVRAGVGPPKTLYQPAPGDSGYEEWVQQQRQFHRPGWGVNVSLGGLGDPVVDAVLQTIAQATQGMVFSWSKSADDLAQSISPTVNASVANVQRGGANVFIADLQKLWANKTLAEKTNYELTQRVMAATGKAPYQMSAQNPGEAMFLQAQKSLTAVSNLADVGLSSYGQQGNDPDSIFAAEASARFESLMQGWANAANGAAAAVQGAGDTLKSGGAAAKTAVDALKEAADAMKKLAPTQPFTVAAFLGGGAVVAVVAVGFLAWLFTGRK